MGTQAIGHLLQVYLLLIGTNGVKLTGRSYDRSGTALSTAGDVNADGIADLIIGSFWANNYAGGAYVVFGHMGNWLTPMSLYSLNNTTGIVFLGESGGSPGNPGDQAGYPVELAGDVNGDGISDLLIGADGVDRGASGVGSAVGAGYVVFGHSGSWSTPFNFSSLDGLNGAKFIGENQGDNCGISVNSAGDINGDNITDLIIGAYGANSYAGASYVVFGHKGSWVTPFNLSALNGTNGVKFAGESINYYSGYWGSSAGDVNRDG